LDDFGDTPGQQYQRFAVLVDSAFDFGLFEDDLHFHIHAG